MVSESYKGKVFMIIYDPICDDNVFTPVSYFLGRRKALKKYEYIRDVFNVNKSIKIYISYNNSSLPKALTAFIPKKMLSLVIKLEVLIWCKINDVNKNRIVKKIDDDNIFCFGYKKFGGLKHEDIKKVKNFYLHLTHYHTYPYNSVYLEDNFQFVFDNNVSDTSYFKSKFPGYNKDILIMPFYVQDRFFECDIDSKRSGIAITGTYHDICPFISDFGIYNRGRTTLHPIRHEISFIKTPDFFKVKLGLFKNPNDLKSLFKRFFDYGQKEYFSFNIVDFYKTSTFSLIAGEGNGALAIGAIESLACGCKPYLTVNEACGLELSSESFNIYSSISDIEYSYKNECSGIDILSPNHLRNAAMMFNRENSVTRFECFLKKVSNND